MGARRKPPAPNAPPTVQTEGRVLAKRIPKEFEGPKAAVTLAQRRALGRAGLWLRQPGAAQMPDDPIRRFEFRMELLRRAQSIAWSQLYHLESDLGAVARANPRYRLSARLSHFEDHPRAKGFEAVMREMKLGLVAAARQLAGEGAPARRPVISGAGEAEAWLRRQLEGLGKGEGA